MPIANRQKPAATEAFGVSGGRAMLEQSRNDLSLHAFEAGLPNPVAAAFRQENLLVNGYMAIHDRTERARFEPVSGYNPLEDPQVIEDDNIRGLEDAFLESRSPEETAFVKQQIRAEQMDQQSLGNQGLLSLPLVLAAAAADPTAFVGIGSVAKAKTALGAAALATGATFAEGLTEEALLGAMQEARPDLGRDELVGLGSMAMVFGSIGGAFRALRPGEAEHLMNGARMDLEAVPELEQALRENGVTSRTFEGMDPEQAQSEFIRLAEKHAPEQTKQLLGNRVSSLLIRTAYSLNPGGRTAISRSPTARQISKQMTSTPFLTKVEEAGQTFGVSVEVRRQKRVVFNLTTGIMNTRDAFKAYRKAGGQEITRFHDFDELVGMAMRRNDEAPDWVRDPELRKVIAETASKNRQEVFEPLWRDAVGVGLYSEIDADLKGTAPSYFTRVYDREMVKAGTDSQGRTFTQLVEQWLIEQGESPERARRVARDVRSQIIGVDRGHIPIPTVREAGPLKDRVLKIPDERIEEFLVSSATDVMRRYTNMLAGEVELARAFQPSPDPRIASLRSELAAARQAIESGRGIEALNDVAERINSTRAKIASESAELSEQIEGLMVSQERLRDRFRSVQAEVERLRAAGEDTSEALGRRREIEGQMKANIDEQRALRRQIREQATEEIEEVEALRAEDRTLREIEDYASRLDGEIAKIRRQQARQGVNLTPQRERIRQEYDELLEQATTAKERDKLTSALNRDLADIDIMRDRILGTAGLPDDPDDFIFNVSQAIKRANLVRVGGGFQFMNISDLPHIIIRHGIRPFVRGMRDAVSGFKAMKQNEIGKALEAAEMSHAANRTMTLADIEDEVVGRNIASKSLKWIADHFAKITGLDLVNATLKRFSAGISTDEILRQSVRWADGKISKSRARDLAAVGIDEAMARRIAAQQDAFEKGTLWLPHTDRWADQEAAEVFKGAVIGDVQSAVIEPGVGDLPRFMSKPIVSNIGQFKSFVHAANTRIMASSLQRGDAAVLAGIVTTVAWGGLIYSLRQAMNGRDIANNPAQFAFEAVDHSGVAGWILEANNMADSLLGIGASRFLGGEGPSRYHSRNAVDALLGPTAGFITDFSTAAGGAVQGLMGEDVTAQQARAVRRMIMLQNTPGLKYAFDRLEQSIEENF